MYEFEYTWSESNACESAKQIYFYALKRDCYTYIVVFIVLFGIAAYIQNDYLFLSVYFAAVYFIYNLYRSFHYHQIVRRDSIRSYGDYNYNYKIEDEEFSMSNDCFHQRVEWRFVTEIIETKDYYFLMSRSAGVATLPKSALPDGAIEFIRAKVGKQTNR